MRSLLLLVALVWVGATSAQESKAEDQISDTNRCFLRCVAGCVAGEAKPISDCSQQCKLYENPNLCDKDQTCWKNCKDLAQEDINWEKRQLNILENRTFDQNYNISWTTVPDAVIYVVQLKTHNGHWDVKDQLVVTETFIKNYNVSKHLDFCAEKTIRIAPIKADAVGSFTDHVLPAPQVIFDSKMSLKSLVLYNKPFPDDGSNGTVVITFEYEPAQWPLGQSDISLEPMWHQVQCVKADLSQVYPNPDFEKGPGNTLIAKVGSKRMYQDCRILYYMGGMSSKRCGTDSPNYSPPSPALQQFNINCTTVKDSGCIPPKIHQAPQCGNMADKIKFDILDKDINLNSNLTVNISWVPSPFALRHDEKTLYYKGVFGEAVRWDNEAQPSAFGVNMTNTIGQVNSCHSTLRPDGTCENSSEYFIVKGIRLNQLYGIVICSVVDVQNTALPVVLGLPRPNRPKSNGFEFLSKDYIKPNVGLYVGLGVAGLLLLIGLIAILSYCTFRSRREKRQMEFHLKTMKREQEDRYTDFPKKQDIWEIERRNLIIYEEKKLGSGAFGSVFLGKLIGKAKAHKDAQSALGVSLMRTENCDVAVKMLPEYADDLSKSEFLREIALMKNLGYHERLVNMLACVTESEPYCLVVEYCSDGDLLHYLRERCEYMLRLDKVGVDYTNPEETNYELDMVITLKQLLMFAVQISYGLDYLAQKKYVHRDVAARNVLVHDKNYCKIGDFGLCRFIYADSANYISQGGRLPIKWMSPEAIRDYEFTSKSDVWSFGVLMFEIITLGGCPYPCIQPDDMHSYLESGQRMEQPDNCPDNFYNVMMQCWKADPSKRPEFSTIRQKLASQLEDITDEYSYLKLDSQKDYYNVRDALDTNQLMPPPDPEIPQKPFKASAQYSQDSGVSTLNHSNSIASDQCLITPVDSKPDWKKFDFTGFSTINETPREDQKNSGYSNEGFQV
ncbi:hypothetical protein L596_021563 [Steinernema carpocapsae]|uniref:Protein kinase domain-containing protein n=1 Tax=Steinernema carpocapsae TaxID=34508 RepID=A0A4V5ZZY8_STECR|nr:hypothetical protein L596_021563 [Steinernema carpocapsae]